MMKINFSLNSSQIRKIKLYVKFFAVYVLVLSSALLVLSSAPSFGNDFRNSNHSKMVNSQLEIKKPDLKNSNFGSPKTSCEGILKEVKIAFVEMKVGRIYFSNSNGLKNGAVKINRIVNQRMEFWKWVNLFVGVQCNIFKFNKMLVGAQRRLDEFAQRRIKKSRL